MMTGKSSTGQNVFLETGIRGPGGSGLIHIVDNHRRSFADIGVPESQISSIIMQVVNEGRIVGHQGLGAERPIYEAIVNGQTQRIAITIGNNGYIVGANPAGSIKRDFKLYKEVLIEGKMMRFPHAIRLMADYFCFPLWEASSGEVGNINPHYLPISRELKIRLMAWASTFDGILDRDDPKNSGFKSDEEIREFRDEGYDLAKCLLKEGREYLWVEYQLP